VASPCSTRLRCSGRRRLGARRVALDHLDLVVGFQRGGDAGADVAAAGDHHPLDRLQHAPQLAHHRPDVLAGGEHEDLVAASIDRVAVGVDRLVLAEDRGDAGIDAGRQVFAHGLDRLAHQQAAVIGADADQGHPPVGELQHLQRLGKLDQARDVVGDLLLRADRMGDGEMLVVEQVWSSR
jgi:hypothetical protein